MLNGTVSVDSERRHVLGHFQVEPGTAVVRVHSILFLPAAVNLCFVTNGNGIPLAPFLHVVA